MKPDSEPVQAARIVAHLFLTSRNNLQAVARQQRKVGQNKTAAVFDIAATISGVGVDAAQLTNEFLTLSQEKNKVPLK